MRNFNGSGRHTASMAGPRIDRKLSRHGSVRPSPQCGGNRTRNRLPRRDCHATRTMVRLTRQRKWRSKCHIRSCQPASGPTQQHNPLGSRGHLHQGLQVEDTHSGCGKVRCLNTAGHQCAINLQVAKIRQTHSGTSSSPSEMTLP